MQRHELEGLSREQLIAQAERLGVARPRVLTQPELMDEIIGRTVKTEGERAKARGWLGRARDLLARVVEKGLHLPEAARVLRSLPDEKGWPPPPPPLPTVTLAEIYAAQGHLERAITVLDDVLTREPNHREARALRTRLAEQARPRSPRSGRNGADLAATDKRSEAEAAKPATLKEQSPMATETPSISTEGEPPAASAAAANVLQVEAVSEQPTVTSALPVETAQAAERGAAPIEAKPAAAVEERATLDDAALPDRYDVDEIVAIAVDPRTVYLYWEVRATSLARAQAHRPEGWLAVRVATVTASWDGPVVTSRDLRVDALYGDRFVRDIQPGSNVRVSVGWRTNEEFDPFAVGEEVTSPRLAPVEVVAQEVARWEARPVHPARVERAGAEEATPNVTGAQSQTGWLSRGASTGANHSGFSAIDGSARRAIGGRPVDTGTEIWGTPHTPESDGGGTEQDATWFVPGGSSELARGGGGGRRRFGGASDLVRI